MATPGTKGAVGTTGVRLIIHTFVQSAKSFVSVLFLVFLVFFFYTVLGMRLWGRVMRQGDGLAPNANFETFGSASLTLFRCATFDNWQVAMWACSIEAPQCDPNISGCGSTILARLYFLSFCVLGQWIAINCFTAVLMDSFSRTDRDDRFSVREEDVKVFLRQWKRTCGRSTRMRTAQIVPFLEGLPAPFGPEFEEGDRRSYQRFMRLLRIPVVDDYVSRQQVFHGLLRTFFGVALPQRTEKWLHKMSVARFRQSETAAQEEGILDADAESPRSGPNSSAVFAGESRASFLSSPQSAASNFSAAASPGARRDRGATTTVQPSAPLPRMSLATAALILRMQTVWREKIRRRREEQQLLTLDDADDDKQTNDNNNDDQ